MSEWLSLLALFQSLFELLSVLITLLVSVIQLIGFFKEKEEAPGRPTRKGH